MRQPPYRYANLIYTWCIERVPSGKLDEWLSGLSEQLPWQDSDSDSAVELESESFFAMQNVGGGERA